jgi:hypothetical protein
MLLLKLDIVKAFDNVRWEYILKILEQMGFGQRWRKMVSLIWSTMTSQVMLNGKLGHPIRHGRGLRQGDPLSPMLFIITMDPLQQLLRLTTHEGLLNPIGAATVKLWTSLYVDNAALFIRPVATELANL